MTRPPPLRLALALSATLALLSAPTSAEPAPNVARFPDAPGAPPSITPAPAPKPREPSSKQPSAPPARAPQAAPVAAPVSWATRAAREETLRGDAWYARGELPRALTAYTRAIQLDSSYAPGYLGLGRSREALGDLQEAERVYTLATRLGVERGQAFELRARLRRATHRHAAANADLAEALRLEPEHHGRLLLASRWYVEAEQWAAALAVWRRLAALHRERGDTEAARAAQVQVRALVILAGEADPVTQPTRGWVGQSLARIARRGG